MIDMTVSTPDAAASPAPGLIVQLAAAPAAAWIGVASIDAFLAERGAAVVFIWSDVARFPECLDVAVVLPELRREVFGTDPAALRIGVVAASDEASIARRFGAERRPSLVFLRDGEYVATVAGMRDWTDFVAAVRAARGAAPSRAPTIGIPIVSAAPPSRVGAARSSGCTAS